jgi:hypothetical protein
VELAFARWTQVPCASVHTTTTDAVKSTWPLQVLGLYLFAFRGADIEMLALNHAYGVEIAVGLIAFIIVTIRVRQAITSRNLEPALDPVADDALLMLKLSEGDA